LDNSTRIALQNGQVKERIRMFLGLWDPDLSLFCTDSDPDLDPSINQQKKKEKTF
jgi:hypothetical protein